MSTEYMAFGGQKTVGNDYVAIYAAILAENPPPGNLVPNSHTVQSVYMDLGTTMIEVGFVKSNWPVDPDRHHPNAVPFVLRTGEGGPIYYEPYAGLPTNGSWHSYEIVSGARWGYNPNWFACYFDGNFLRWAYGGASQGRLQAFGEVKWLEGTTKWPQMGLAYQYLYVIKAGEPWQYRLWTDPTNIIDPAQFEPQPPPPVQATYDFTWAYNYYYFKDETIYS